MGIVSGGPPPVAIRYLKPRGTVKQFEGGVPPVSIRDTTPVPLGSTEKLDDFFPLKIAYDTLFVRVPAEEFDAAKKKLKAAIDSGQLPGKPEGKAIAYKIPAAELYAYLDENYPVGGQ
jgi:hypothetical protein